MPKVSVIVPVYNVAEYIERCARSLFEQTMDDLEYIFIDDCSCDESISTLNSIIAEYPHRRGKCRIISMDINRGQAAVRKLGARLAGGDYILYCDSDDWLDLDMVEKMHSKAVDYGADIVMVDVYKEYLGYKELVKVPYSSKRKELISALVRGETIYLWNKLIKRVLFLEHLAYLKEGLDMSEDYSIVVPTCISAKNIEYVSDTYYHYVQYNSNAITKKKITQKEVNGWIHSVNCVTEYLRENTIDYYSKDLLYRKLIIRYWCMLYTDGRMQITLAEIYPEINREYSLLSFFNGIRQKILFFFVLRGNYRMFNILYK